MLYKTFCISVSIPAFLLPLYSTLSDQNVINSQAILKYTFVLLSYFITLFNCVCVYGSVVGFFACLFFIILSSPFVTRKKGLTFI